MHRHLVAIEVGIEGRAHQGVNLYGAALHQHRLKGLDSQAMQGGSTVEQNRVLMNNFFQDVPDLLITSFNHSLGTFNRIGQSVLFEFANNERLIQLQSYFFRKAALIEFKIRTYYNYRPS